MRCEMGANDSGLMKNMAWFVAESGCVCGHNKDDGCEVPCLRCQAKAWLEAMPDPEGVDHRKHEVIRLITSGMTRVGGKYYRIAEKDFMAMSLDALYEVWRFIRDAEQEEMMKVNKARREPWRRG